MESRKKGFESLSRVAVVGASSNDAKPSAKILRYLLSIGKKAIPINPRYKTLQNQDCLPSLQGISEPENTAVSIVVNPKVTLKVLKTAEEIGIPYLWLQPGTTDAAVLSYI
ncbi:NAD(P)-binding protein, partial [Dendrothele bispora CBS 962.96]